MSMQLQKRQKRVRAQHEGKSTARTRIRKLNTTFKLKCTSNDPSLSMRALVKKVDTSKRAMPRIIHEGLRCMSSVIEVIQDAF